MPQRNEGGFAAISAHVKQVGHYNEPKSNYKVNLIRFLKLVVGNHVKHPII